MWRTFYTNIVPEFYSLLVSKFKAVNNKVCLKLTNLRLHTYLTHTVQYQSNINKTHNSLTTIIEYAELVKLGLKFTLFCQQPIETGQ